MDRKIVDIEDLKKQNGQCIVIDRSYKNQTLKARVICYDAKGHYNLIVLVDHGSFEYPYLFSEVDGKCPDKEGWELNPDDLIFAELGRRLVSYNKNILDPSEQTSFQISDDLQEMIKELNLYNP